MKRDVRSSQDETQSGLFPELLKIVIPNIDNKCSISFYYPQNRVGSVAHEILWAAYATTK
jgi:hypothetical protein